MIVCVAWALVGEASAAVARSSSEGTGDENVRYVAGNAFDGLLATGATSGRAMALGLCTAIDLVDRTMRVR